MHPSLSHPPKLNPKICTLVSECVVLSYVPVTGSMRILEWYCWISNPFQSVSDDVQDIVPIHLFIPPQRLPQDTATWGNCVRG